VWTHECVIPLDSNEAGIHYSLEVCYATFVHWISIQKYEDSWTDLCRSGLAACGHQSLPSKLGLHMYRLQILISNNLSHSDGDQNDRVRRLGGTASSKAEYHAPYLDQ
jgi:hypothetical protein